MVEVLRTLPPALAARPSSFHWSHALEILIVLVVLVGAVGLFVTERLRVDLVAVLVLLALALTGLVTPAQAVSGFSSPAVVTICGIFILSAGLQRTGVANYLGRWVERMGGHSEVRLILALMVTAAVLSFFMNTMAIVALFLPAVMDLARRTGLAPSRLLMPLTFGALLGGLTTMFATLPNSPRQRRAKGRRRCHHLECSTSCQWVVPQRWRESSSWHLSADAYCPCGTCRRRPRRCTA